MPVDLSNTPSNTLSNAALTLAALTVRYPNATQDAVQALSLSLRAGEIACLIGASGCGKTSALRAIAGFIRMQSGRISLGNLVISSEGAHLAPQQRGIGLMFQDLALFPHLTVAGNIAFGLNQHSAAEQAARTAHLLEVVGLQGLQQRYPHELSGGQQQRVALARALAPKPRLLLLDEPFSRFRCEPAPPVGARYSFDSKSRGRERLDGDPRST
jgi:iron(III) transport system ATP-binding protein